MRNDYYVLKLDEVYRQALIREAAQERRARSHRVRDLAWLAGRVLIALGRRLQRLAGPVAEHSGVPGTGRQGVRV